VLESRLLPDIWVQLAEDVVKEIPEVIVSTIDEAPEWTLELMGDAENAAASALARDIMERQTVPDCDDIFPSWARMVQSMFYVR